MSQWHRRHWIGKQQSFREAFFQSYGRMTMRQRRKRWTRWMRWLCNGAKQGK